MCVGVHSAFTVYAFTVYAFTVYAFTVYAFTVYAFTVYAFTVYCAANPSSVWASSMAGCGIKRYFQGFPPMPVACLHQMAAALATDVLGLCYHRRTDLSLFASILRHGGRFASRRMPQLIFP